MASKIGFFIFHQIFPAITTNYNREGPQFSCFTNTEGCAFFNFILNNHSVAAGVSSRSRLVYELLIRDL